MLWLYYEGQRFWFQCCEGCRDAGCCGRTHVASSSLSSLASASVARLLQLEGSRWRVLWQVSQNLIITSESGDAYQSVGRLVAFGRSGDRLAAFGHWSPRCCMLARRAGESERQKIWSLVSPLCVPNQTEDDLAGFERNTSHDIETTIQYYYVSLEHHVVWLDDLIGATYHLIGWPDPHVVWLDDLIGTPYHMIGWPVVIKPTVLTVTEKIAQYDIVIDSLSDTHSVTFTSFRDIHSSSQLHSIHSVTSP